MAIRSPARLGAARGSILPGHGLRFVDARPHYDVSRDVVLFPADANGRRVLCAISREALEDHFGAEGMTREERLDVFRKHRREIERMARLVYVNKQVPVDATVLITTADVPTLRRLARPPAGRSSH